MSFKTFPVHFVAPVIATNITSPHIYLTNLYPQLAFTCSNLTTETLEQSVKYVQK